MSEPLTLYQETFSAVWSALPQIFSTKETKESTTRYEVNVCGVEAPLINNGKSEFVVANAVIKQTTKSHAFLGGITTKYLPVAVWVSSATSSETPAVDTLSQGVKTVVSGDQKFSFIPLGADWVFRDNLYKDYGEYADENDTSDGRSPSYRQASQCGEFNLIVERSTDSLPGSQVDPKTIELFFSMYDAEKTKTVKTNTVVNLATGVFSKSDPKKTVSRK